MTDEQHQQWCKDLDELHKLKADYNKLKEAFGLARSMILSGEKMTPQAEEIFEQALKG